MLGVGGVDLFCGRGHLQTRETGEIKGNQGKTREIKGNRENKGNQGKQGKQGKSRETGKSREIKGNQGKTRETGESKVR